MHTTAISHAGAEPARLFDIVGALGVERRHEWAWQNYQRFVKQLAKDLHATHIMEIGGGRNPLFTPEEIKTFDLDIVVNDISATELACLPPDYRTACFDVSAPGLDAGNLRNKFDLMFSCMVFEHVLSGKHAWTNTYELLAPNGVAVAFVPTLYSIPFVLNLLLPDRLASRIVEAFFPNRTDGKHPVFPAHYSWCYASETVLAPRLKEIGFSQVAILPFYGHDYYVRIPLVNAVHRQVSKLLQQIDFRMLASYAYIVVQK